MHDLTLGDTLNFTTSVPDYTPAEGWVLKYRLVPRVAGPTPISLASIADSEDPSLHRVQVAAADTAAWVAGSYSWFSYVEKDAEQYSVGSGSVSLLPDPRTSTSLDSRSTARAALDNVRALLAGKASSDVLSYSINGRQLQHYSMTELLLLESKLKGDVQREDQCAAIAAGLPSRRQLVVRLGARG